MDESWPVNSAAQVPTCADIGCAVRRNKIRGIHMRSVRGFRNIQWHLHCTCELLVGRNTEFAHRLFIPEVICLSKRMAQIDGVRKIKSGGPVIHQGKIWSDMGA